MSDHVVVIGAGGHAKVIISMLRLCGYQPVAVFDDNDALKGTQLLGVKVSGPICEINPKEYRWGVIGIGHNSARKKLDDTMRLDWLTLIHPTAWVDGSVELGPGSIVCAGAMIQPGTRIGKHAIVNTGATVDHDCRIDDFVHIAPGTHLAGNVHVGEGAFLGISSAAIPGTRIGAWTMIGAGAVVIRDIPPRVVAYGIPAIPHRSAGPAMEPVTPDVTPPSRADR